MELSHQVGKLQRRFRPHGKGVLCCVLLNSAQGQGGGGLGSDFTWKYFTLKCMGPSPIPLLIGSVFRLKQGKIIGGAATVDKGQTEGLEIFVLINCKNCCQLQPPRSDVLPPRSLFSPWINDQSYGRVVTFSFFNLSFGVTRGHSRERTPPCSLRAVKFFRKESLMVWLAINRLRQADHL